MSAADLQSFLRFLSQDAKVPLAMAMGKIKDLQKADLDSPDKLAKTKPDDIETIFPDEKVAKQIITAAKRVAKLLDHHRQRRRKRSRSFPMKNPHQQN